QPLQPTPPTLFPYTTLFRSQLDGQQHRGKGRGERGRHASRGARHQQRFSLSGRQVKQLGDERAAGAAGHDDRPLRTEWPAGPNGDRKSTRLNSSHVKISYAV